MPTSDPDQFLNTDQAAAFLSLSASYLKKLRLVGDGPTFSTLGSGGRPDGIRYRRGNLLTWAEDRSAKSTSERDAMAAA